MKKFKLQSLALLIIATLLSFSTFAQDGNDKCPANGKETKCSNIPNLTPDQQTKITNLKTSHMKEMQDFKNQLGEKEAHLNTLRTADKPDMAAINKTLDEIGVIKVNMSKKREQHIQDVRSLLTAEQKVYFDSKGHHKGHGKGGCKGSGKEKGCCHKV